MTSVVRYVNQKSAAGTAAAPESFNTTGKDYMLVNFEWSNNAQIGANATSVFKYTGSGTIKNIAFFQVTTAAGAIKTDADTLAVAADGVTLTYTCLANALAADGFVNMLLVVGNY